MTEKRLFVGRKTCEDRFTIINDYDSEIGVKENRSGDVLVLKHNDLNAQQFVAQLVVFLNDQNQAIVDLYDGSKYWSDKATEKIKELEKENEQLNQEVQEYIKALNKTLEEKEELWKENEQLKFDLQKLQDSLWTTEKIRELEKENEQLKQFKEDVFNKIDMHLRMLPTARDNEFNEDDGDPSLYTGAIYMLETLKKELNE